ncbi:alcohol dehydrogenase zinc-binding domain-containing protein [Linderina pennispora]|uniref:Alcohol dehydrogenase zinc-binding domain-containing protein n=1 Tax=Linderina pennispora TaxID=61395 RepID=A0A1Y1W482_9FUNG|nr:alcohol dehydrogenase zinc-binding domain-containing protein [Linderina pennispora]ORX68383.1 alcohol dehydrogenase zinc-binding domain-containing protein [Linderina pennispora]
MSAESITRVILNNYVPDGTPNPSDFRIETVPAPTADMLRDSELLVRPLYLSCDPYMRNRINGRDGYYIDGLKAAAPIAGLGLGVVEASTSSGFAPGDFVTGGFFDWAQKAIVPAAGFSKVSETDRVSLVDYVGVLGMPSFAAYVGLVTLGKPKKGETLLVSSAAGAVGQMVVQLAKIRGLRVVGVAGSDKKVEFVKSLGADAAFNYKTCGNFEQAIRQAAPEGVDIYFDNVGGEFLDAALMNMRPYGRVAACGQASQYNVTANETYRMDNFLQVINRKLNVTGYVITDHYPTPSFAEFLAEVDEVIGLENGPTALIDVFVGNNFGKRIIRV